MLCMHDIKCEMSIIIILAKKTYGVCVIEYETNTPTVFTTVTVYSYPTTKEPCVELNSSFNF